MRLRPALLPLLPLLPLLLALLALGVLLHGLQVGELAMPIKGAGLLRISRTGHPLGFLLLAVAYAAMAGAALWLSWLLAHHGGGGRADTSLPPTPSPTPRARRDAPPQEATRMLHIEIHQHGRGGDVVVRTAHGEQRFYWEFGGGDCIALVSVPDAAQWPTLPALAPFRRDELLTELAERIRAAQCPGTRIEIDDHNIAFIR